MIKITRRCLCALVIWRKPWFLSQGPVLGALCHRVSLSTDASLTGWGVEIVLSSGSVKESSSFVAHKLPGDDGGLQCIETLPSRPEGPSHRTDNTSVVSYINP